MALRVLEGVPRGSVLSWMLKNHLSHSGLLRVSSLGGEGADFTDRKTAFEM